MFSGLRGVSTGRGESNEIGRALLAGGLVSEPDGDIADLEPMMVAVGQASDAVPGHGR